MTSFPMTAPRFTDEDERRELEGLSEAERAEIERDVKGDDASPEVADLDPILAKSLVAEAMEAIDSSERQAYDLAIRTNGQLVDSESNPVWYLRCCRHDPWVRLLFDLSGRILNRNVCLKHPLSLSLLHP